MYYFINMENSGGFQQGHGKRNYILRVPHCTEHRGNTCYDSLHQIYEERHFKHGVRHYNPACGTAGTPHTGHCLFLCQAGVQTSGHPFGRQTARRRSGRSGNRTDYLACLCHDGQNGNGRFPDCGKHCGQPHPAVFIQPQLSAGSPKPDAESDIVRRECGNELSVSTFSFCT